jgi:septal ring factor EnvC (AmiA/AmiB activator)
MTSEIITSGGVAAAVAAIWRFLRTDAGRRVLASFKLPSARQSCEEVRSALETLSQVVKAQGESLEWLRSELSKARQELEDEKSRLEADNVKLRKRVAELEAQVKVLEGMLAARKRNVTSNVVTKSTRRKK